MKKTRFLTLTLIETAMTTRAVCPGHEFVFRTNPNDVVGVARTLEEFKEFVGSVDFASIAYHLRGECNDFAAWAAGSLNDPALAKHLGTAKKARKPETIRNRLIRALEGSSVRRKKS